MCDGHNCIESRIGNIEEKLARFEKYNKRRIVAVLLLLLVFICSFIAQSLPEQKGADEAFMRFVRIYATSIGTRGFASGVRLDHSHILTVSHIALPGTELYSGHTKLQEVARDETKDLLLLRFPSPDFSVEPIRLARAVDYLDELVAVSNSDRAPYSHRVYVTKGFLSYNITFFAASAPGESGSGLFSEEEGCLAGVVTGNDETTMRNSYTGEEFLMLSARATSVEAVRQFLEEAGLSYKPGPSIWFRISRLCFS